MWTFLPYRAPTENSCFGSRAVIAEKIAIVAKGGLQTSSDRSGKAEACPEADLPVAHRGPVGPAQFVFLSPSGIPALRRPS